MGSDQRPFGRAVRPDGPNECLPYTPAVRSAGPVVEFIGLGVRIGDTPILRGVDLTIERGEVVGIHGGNGSGKTTLLRVAAALLAPTEGRGAVLGADLFSDERFQVRGRIGLIGHAPALYPQLTLEENTAFVASVAGRDQMLVGDVLAKVGLAGARHRRVDQCSHGMQRRAEFARILLLEPDLLLLDEAHAGLDPLAVDLVSVLTRRTTSRGGAVILVTHDAQRAASIVDRAYETGAGRLVELQR